MYSREKRASHTVQGKMKGFSTAEKKIENSFCLATDWPINWPKSVSYWPWAMTIVKPWCTNVERKKENHAMWAALFTRTEWKKRVRWKRKIGTYERNTMKEKKRKKGERENGERKTDREGDRKWKKKLKRIWTKCKIKIQENRAVHRILRQNSKFVESKWTSLPVLALPLIIHSAFVQRRLSSDKHSPLRFPSAPSQNIREYQGILHPGINVPNHLARFRSRIHPSLSWTR